MDESEETNEQPGQVGPAPTPGVRWKDVRFNGALICRVNADNPGHIQVMANVHHGKRRIFEVSVSALAVTGV